LRRWSQRDLADLFDVVELVACLVAEVGAGLHRRCLPPSSACRTMPYMKLELSPVEAREIREAILETRNDWSPVLDRVTKDIQAKLDRLAEISGRH
jgi:hypothetical protein